MPAKMPSTMRGMRIFHIMVERVSVVDVENRTRIKSAKTILLPPQESENKAVIARMASNVIKMVYLFLMRNSR
jgi:hypothetical protein